MYFRRVDGRLDVGLFDWQVVQFCPGMRDVSYFLLVSLDAELLRLHERELVASYAHSLRACGVPDSQFNEETAWRQYRAQTWAPLEAAVFTLAFGDDKMQ